MAVQATAREVVTTLARRTLQAFLQADCRLDCRPSAAPRASLLVPVHNHSELTLLCLQSLALRQNQTPFEIIVVDNNSTDETARLLKRVQGLGVIHNRENLGYPGAINQAARLASGEFLVLLNNDIQVLGNSVDRAVAYLEANADVGAVGGQVILLDGSLQEAGVTLGRDGWMYCHGVGESPDDPAYAFEREVDYCSAAFLVTRRRLFHELGGLDEVFSPGYFEESDYCARLWQAGWRVVYLPGLAILHFQNATSAALPNLMQLVHRNHQTFVQKQAGWLATRSGCTWSLLARRAAANSKFHVLLAEKIPRGEDIPADFFSEVEEVVRRMESLDAFVTVCLIGGVTPGSDVGDVRLPRTVEVVHLDHPAELPEWLDRRAAYYDLIVSRDRSLIAGCTLPVYARARSAVLRDGRLELVSSSHWN
jgi:O-antigen biosynthesis protein